MPETGREPAPNTHSERRGRAGGDERRRVGGRGRGETEKQRERERERVGKYRARKEIQ